MLSLSSSQFLAIVNAAAALCPTERDAFIATVAQELAGQPLGDGTVGRAIRAAQVRFAHPMPDPVPPKWARKQPHYEKQSRLVRLVAVR